MIFKFHPKNIKILVKTFSVSVPVVFAWGRTPIFSAETPQHSEQDLAETQLSIFYPRAATFDKKNNKNNIVSGRPTNHVAMNLVPESTTDFYCSSCSSCQS